MRFDPSPVFPWLRRLSSRMRITNNITISPDGLQLLHAVHAVEQLLAKLAERGCNFHVLWFDRHESLAVPPLVNSEYGYKYFLARSVLIWQLSTAETKPKMSYRFLGIDSHDFRDYTSTHAVRFMLCSDGEPPNDACRARAWPHRVIAHEFMRLGYPVAFLDDIEFRSSRVRKEFLRPCSASRS